LPDEALALASPRNEWTVAMIVAHIVDAAAWYASLLDGSVCPPDVAVPTTSADIAAIAEACAAADARLRAVASLPDGMVEKDPGRYNKRSTILSQSIHHATEHRAQVAGALSTNGINVIDLDALDVWAYGEAEGLGA
ncbi:MAG: DinB family protein, partial [Chloroflexota bacterium]